MAVLLVFGLEIKMASDSQTKQKPKGYYARRYGAAIACAFALFAYTKLIQWSARTEAKPQSVALKDLDGDSLDDLIVSSKDGTPTVFMASINARGSISYCPLDYLQNLYNSSNDTRYEEDFKDLSRSKTVAHDSLIKRLTQRRKEIKEDCQRIIKAARDYLTGTR
jgi:hypothetical protein